MRRAVYSAESCPQGDAPRTSTSSAVLRWPTPPRSVMPLGIVRSHRPGPTVVVVSAMAGVTDACSASPGTRNTESGTPATAVSAPCARGSLSRGAGVRPRAGRGPGRAGRIDWRRSTSWRALVDGLRLVRELTPRTSDYMVSAASGSAPGCCRGRARSAAAVVRVYVDARRTDPSPTALRPRRRPTTAATDRRRCAAAAAPARAGVIPGGARLHRRTDRPARSRRWAAADPTSPPRCWAARSARAEVRSGRTCRAC